MLQNYLASYSAVRKPVLSLLSLVAKEETWVPGQQGLVVKGLVPANDRAIDLGTAVGAYEKPPHCPENAVEPKSPASLCLDAMLGAVIAPR